MEPFIDVEGAIGDGVADDGPAIQSALNQAWDVGLPVRLLARSYMTKQRLNNPGVEVFGCIGRDRTRLLAGAPMDALMRMGGVGRVRQLELWNRGVADHSLDFRASSYSVIESVRCYQPRIDGFHCSAGAGLGNDSVIFRDCSVELAGFVYKSEGRALPSCGAPKLIVSGTVSTVAGGHEIVGEGTNFTTELVTVRPGDFIAVGTNHADTEWFRISDIIDDEHIIGDQFNPSTRTASGLNFAVFCGGAYYEEVSNENNNNKLEHFRALNCAGGIVTQSLYGLKGQDLQIDATGSFPIVLGQGPAVVAPGGIALSDIYVETLDEIAPAVVYVGLVRGFDITTVEAGVRTIHPYNPSLGSGRVRNELNNSGVYETAYGDALSLVPARRLEASEPIASGFSPPSPDSLPQHGVQAFADPNDGSIVLGARFGNFIRTVRLPTS